MGEVKIALDELDNTLSRIYSVGEQINDILENYLMSCISKGEARTVLNPLPITISVLWAGICGVIALAHKKEKYISNKMNVSKDVFMQSGFNILLRTILPVGNIYEHKE